MKTVEVTYVQEDGTWSVSHKVDDVSKFISSFMNALSKQTWVLIDNDAQKPTLLNTKYITRVIINT